MNLLDSFFGFPRVPLQRTYSWDCIMPDVWGAGILGLVISKFIQDVSFGEYNISEVSELIVGAKKNFFPDKLSIEEPTLTVVAPIPDVVSNYFHVWRKLIIDDQGYFHVANDYKKRIYIILYSRSGIPVNMISLKGVFPKAAPSWKLSYADENVVKYTIGFKCDDVKTGLGAFSSFGQDAGTAFGEFGGAVKGAI